MITLQVKNISCWTVTNAKTQDSSAELGLEISTDVKTGGRCVGGAGDGMLRLVLFESVRELQAFDELVVGVLEGERP